MAELIRKTFFWPFLLHFVVGQLLLAQSVLTLEESVELFEQRNPAVQSRREQIEGAQGRLKQAGVWPNPQLNYSQEGYPVGSDAETRYFDDQEFIFWASQRIELGDKRGHRREIARFDVDIARRELDNFLRDGKVQVKGAFLQAAFAARKKELSEEQLLLYYNIRDVHRNRFEAGDVSGLAQLRIDLEEVRFISVLAVAENDFNDSWSKLATLIRWPQPQAPRLEIGEKELTLEVSLDEVQELAAASRPDLKGQALRVDKLAQQVQLAKVQRIPDLTLGGGYKRDFGVNSFYAAANIPIPLFDRNQGGIMGSMADLRQAQNDLLWRELLVRSEVSSSYKNYQQQLFKFERLERDLLEKAGNVLEITQRSYQEGEASLMDYLDALRNRLEMSLTLFELELELHRARAQLEHAVGVDLQ